MVNLLVTLLYDLCEFVDDIGSWYQWSQPPTPTAAELYNEYDRFQRQCREDEFEHEGQVFSLDYRTVSGDVSLPENAFRTQDFLPHGKTP